jgi:hypothetical protein
MPDVPTQGWFVARNREQEGPFSIARLREMARSGWLSADDLIWHPSLPDWTAARDIPGLFGGTLARYLHATIPGLRRPAAPTPGGPHEAPTPTRRRARRRKERTRPRRWRAPEIDVGDVSPRHLIAMGGGLLAALGVAFACIEHSPLVAPFIAGGLGIAIVSLLPEAGRLLIRLMLWLDAVRQRAAERRLRAREMALEQARLEAEAARIEAERQAAAASWSAPVRPERLVVIHDPPVKRWSPSLAALLSIVVPGLGHFYRKERSAGIGWFVAVVVGYSLFTGAGVILHLCCITAALGGNPWTPGETRVVRES